MSNSNPLDYYLSKIYAHTPLDTYLSATTITPDGKTNHTFFKANDKQKLSDYLNNQKALNVFVRITPLLAPPVIGRGLACDSAGSSVLWVDCDKYSTIAELQANLEKLQFPPSLIVHSGQGIHIYWFLNKFETDLDAIKSANIALGEQISAIDKSTADHCFDLARVLRVPGSINYKYPHEPKCYIYADIPDRIYDLAMMPKSQRQDILPMHIISDAEPLPADFTERIFTADKILYHRLMSVETAVKKGKAEVKNGTLDRSLNDAVCITRLLALDFTPQQCITALMHPEFTTGLRYREDRRYDYITTTVNNVFYHWSQQPQRFFIGKKLATNRILDHITGNHSAMPFLYTTENLWRYSDGYYHSDGEAYVRKRVRLAAGNQVTIHQLDEIIAQLKDLYTIPYDECNIASGELINVRNGMLNLHTCELLPHDMSYRNLYQLPTMYTPTAPCEYIDNYIKSVLPFDTINFFWEYIGSCLLTNMYWPKAFLVLVGEKDTGKSTLLSFIASILGMNNVINHNLHTLAESAYAKSELVGKLANIFSDLDSREVGNVGQIKALTGNDTISAERKFKDSFAFTSKTRLIFSANDYPMVREPDQAFFGRTKIIYCKNVFDARNASIDLLSTLQSQDNLDAALIRMVQGLQRVLQQKTFSTSATLNKTHNEYTLRADSVCGFLEQCPKTLGSNIRKTDLYTAYTYLCKEINKHPVNRDNFFKRVADMSPRFNIDTKFVTRSDGTKESYYLNIGAPEKHKLVMSF